jgi:hypothetical protein
MGSSEGYLHLPASSNTTLSIPVKILLDSPDVIDSKGKHLINLGHLLPFQQLATTMKQFFILFVWVAFAQMGRAQTIPYTFIVDQADYVPLTNAIAANDGVWDDPDITTPLGFQFELWGQPMTSIFWYGELTANIVGGLPNADPTPLLISYGADLIDRGYDSGVSLSPISYKTEGAPGSRIFKMEWANAGFFEDETGDAFTNMQVWLYEGTNNIEIRFGPTQVNDLSVFTDFSGPLIGLMDQYSINAGTFQNLYYLAGPTEHPTLNQVSLSSADTLNATLNDAPGNGLVYRFTTNTVGINTLNSLDQQVRVFPSLATDAISIAFDSDITVENSDFRYRITDQLGKNVQGGTMTDALTRVDVSSLPAGAYYVTLYSPEHLLATKKVWKQ